MRMLSRLTTGISFTLMVVAMLCGESLAQYRTMKPDARRRQYRAEVAKMLTGSKAYDRKIAQKYYVNSLLAELATAAPKADGAMLYSVRTTILKELSKVSNPTTRKQLVRDLVSWCGALASTKARYHPIAQYHAMMILGQLDDQEAKSSATGARPPVPSKDALRRMRLALRDPAANDAVKTAALIGVHRHALIHRAGQKLADPGVLGDVLKLVKSPCPSNRTKEGHEWMQRRGIAILGAVGMPGKGNVIPQVLTKIINDEEASIAIRCAAIESLGQMRFGSADGLDIEATTLGVATTTVQVCRRTNKDLENRWNERDPSFGPSGGGGYGGGGGDAAGGYGGYGGGGGGYGGYGGGGGGYGGYGGYSGGDGGEEEKQPEDELLTEARRKIKQQLGCVQTGVTGILRVAQQDQSLNEIKTLLDGLMTEIDADGLDVNDFRDKVEEVAADLAETHGIETEEKASDKDLEQAPEPPAGEGQPEEGQKPANKEQKDA